MRHIYILFVLLLSGCAGTPFQQTNAWQAAEQNYFTAEKACDTLRQQKKIKTHYDAAACIEENAEEQMLRASPDSAPVRAYMIEIKTIGNAIDQKEISVNEGKIARERSWGTMMDTLAAKQATTGQEGNQTWQSFKNQVQSQALSTLMSRIAAGL